MTDNKVAPEAYERSLPVPKAFAITMAWGRDFWLNQENGNHEDSVERPTVSDVKQVLGGME